MDLSLFEKHSDWFLVQKIAQILISQGHQAVLAGGGVRDVLLGKIPQDLDMATDARPEQVEALFDKVVPVGKSFGVCRVVEDGHEIEVATFREEDGYEDGRRPQHIQYSTMEKDALRRDFTVNALFLDLKSMGCIDLVNGRQDLQQKILRCVGEPSRRFSEDYLRILRAARFQSQLGFKVEAETAQAMKDHSADLSKISKERILEECHKAFQSPQPFLFLQESQRCDFWNLVFFPMPYEAQDFEKFFAKSLSSTWAWAYLGKHFRQSTGASMKQVLNLLKEKKISNKDLSEVQAIWVAEDFLKTPDLNRFLLFAKGEHWNSVRGFWEMEESRLRGEKKHKTLFADYKNRYFPQGTWPQPLIKGDDVKGLGLEPVQFGEFLERAYHYQLTNPEARKEQVLQAVKEVFQKKN